jgi:hypothetical protein
MNCVQKETVYSLGALPYFGMLAGHSSRTGDPSGAARNV